jgi:transglutaminase-like putative cysteine protease
MNTARANLSRLIFNVLCALWLLSGAVFAGNNDNWKPIAPEELAMKEPMIEKDADAEALLWDVYVAGDEVGGSYQTVLQHYLRIKIFTQRGSEQFSKVDIPFFKVRSFNVKIKDIAARTVKPDGSIVELKPEDIFEREIVKGDGVKIKAKSFAVPAIAPGTIIEYRWKETRGIISYYQKLEFAREIPIHLVQYHVKAVPDSSYLLHGQVFNGENSPFTKEKDGYYITSMRKVPSFKEEPQMPSEYAVRPWLLLYYTPETAKTDPAKFWKEHGKQVYENHKGLMKVSGQIAQTTAQVVGDASTPEQKIERIFNFVRSKVKNIYDDSLNLSSEQLKSIKANKTPADTLERGQGNGHDINMLFAAMAAAAGLEPRVAELAPHTSGNFNINFADDYFLQTEDIAIKVNDQWRFYDPASKYVPFGMLVWQEEGSPALISDPKEPVFVATPVSAPEKSLEKRTGKFKLLEDGTLEGDVRMEFTGNIAAYHKEYNDDDTAQKREETLRNLVKANILGSAEVSNIQIENITDPDKPFVYAFKVTVPGYATRTGKRLFIQPNVFERSSKPIFETTIRRYDIQFRYPYAEQDDIMIDLPAGYKLESADAPGLMEDGQKISLDNIFIGVTKDGKTLVYKRNFYFGNKGLLAFPVKSYPALKQLFEAYYKANTHTLTLKQDIQTASK